MIRDGTRQRHPGQPIVPVLLLRGYAREYRCLCGRPVHFEARYQRWRHHQRPWHGVRRACGIEREMAA